MFQTFLLFGKICFTANEMELVYQHQKLNIRNLKKVPEMLEFDGEYATILSKAKFV